MGELLRVRGLRKSYTRRSRPLAKRIVQALDGVDLELDQGRTLGLMGESGSGKSTLARCIAGLERPDSGEIIFDGRPIAGRSKRELCLVRRQIQVIFQDPATSMNPGFTAAEVVEEPMLFEGRRDAAGRRRRMFELLE